MCNKLLAVFAALCAVLLATRTASCEDVDVQPPNELYVLNPGSAFPFIVTDPNSPVLSMNIEQAKLGCTDAQCMKLCKSLGFKTGKCNGNGWCLCSR